MRAIVYMKIAVGYTGDPTGLTFTSAHRDAIRNRIQGILTQSPRVTVTEAHLADNARLGRDFFSPPKIVLVLDVPETVTHAKILKAFDDDGFVPWVKNAVRNQTPPGLTITEWAFKLSTTIGKVSRRTLISQPGP